ncbi:hypothetical protein Val02_73050 [Virgisporangium aliadipatigenens]|uniref:Uncharacterized protein n=1 Tax=Virgisporangium aliadipatigenens TaxID=741659 RepID=A0A8J3YRB5_9ACTN|nr:hypothetical protein [Virgisporangium aliadipatigenens]GIJ50419.1 hypothetical protein Val02_73050 [Virgisporangium aliadipatigenens]
MTTRLSFDLDGTTCADLWRYADALRASGTPGDTPLTRPTPNRVEAAVPPPTDAAHPGGEPAPWPQHAAPTGPPPPLAASGHPYSPGHHPYGGAPAPFAASGHPHSPGHHPYGGPAPAPQADPYTYADGVPAGQHAVHAPHVPHQGHGPHAHPGPPSPPPARPAAPHLSIFNETRHAFQAPPPGHSRPGPQEQAHLTMTVGATTLDRWRGAIGEALRAEGLSESARASLAELHDRLTLPAPPFTTGLGS